MAIKDRRAQSKNKRLKQYIISGLLTMVVTATAIGGFLFMRQRFFPGNTLPDIHAIEVEDMVLTAVSMDHSAWISDGKLHIAGDSYEEQEAVESWQRLVQVAISDDHLVALDHTGQAYAIGNNHDLQCDIDGQQYITYIAAGLSCTAAVTVDGKIHIYGVIDDAIRRGLTAEESVRRVDLGDTHAVVLHKDGTVAAYGANDNGECEVSGWTGMEQICAGHGYTVGLTTSGKIRYTGDDSYSQQDAQGWSHMCAVSGGTGHVAGIREDGTAVATGRNTQGECEVEDWKDIVSIAAGYDHTLGLDSEGKAYAVGYNGHGQCDVQ